MKKTNLMMMHVFFINARITKMEAFMTNQQAVKGLKTIKTYCSSTLLEELEYAIKVIEKLESEGISEPLTTDFSTLKKN